jgi:hypothetical protein
MGAWGVGTSENDDASDWVFQLLAAAEVVAALIGRPAADRGRIAP